MLSASCVHMACAHHSRSRSFSQSSSQSSHSAPAWWGFSTSADRQRIESFLRRAAGSGLWESATTVEELVLVKTADERLFFESSARTHHVLDVILPPKSDTQHNLGSRETAP